MLSLPEPIRGKILEEVILSSENPEKDYQSLALTCKKFNEEASLPMALFVLQKIGQILELDSNLPVERSWKEALQKKIRAFSKKSFTILQNNDLFTRLILFPPTCKEVLRELTLPLCFQHVPAQKSFLFQLTNLESLTLSDQSTLSKITDAFLEQIAMQLTKLKAINLIKCTHFTSEGFIQFITTYAHQLESLNINGCYQITNETLKQLPQLDHLESIHLPSSITDEGLKALSEKCPHLKKITLDNLHITDEGLISLAKHCPELEEVSVQNCIKLTDRGITTLREHCKNLRQINTHLCFNVSH